MVYGFLTSKPALAGCRRNSDLSETCPVIRNLPQGQEGQLPPWVILILLDVFFPKQSNGSGASGEEASSLGWEDLVWLLRFKWLSSPLEC